MLFLDNEGNQFLQDVDWDKVAKEKELEDSILYKGLISLELKDDVDTKSRDLFYKELKNFGPIEFDKNKYVNTTWIVSVNAVHKLDALNYIIKAIAEIMEQCEGVEHLTMGIHLSPLKLNFTDMPEPFRKHIYHPAAPIILELNQNLLDDIECNLLQWSNP